MADDDNMSIFDFHGSDEENEIEIDLVYDNIEV
jgi:hypothetical protein